MRQLTLFLLGPFHAGLDGEEVAEFKSQRVRALLAYLAVEVDRSHSRPTLAALLWPEWSDQEAINNLRYALYNLRHAIQDQQADPPYLLIDRDTIQFNPTSQVHVDVLRFIQLLQADQNRPMLGERLAEAIQLYRGEFLEGFASPDSLEFDQWMTQKREELHHQLVEALGTLTDCYAAQGNYIAALKTAQRQVETEPWQEQGHRQLLRLLAVSGQRNAALVHYQHYAQQLQQELGVKPDEETRQLFELIQQDSQALALPQYAPGKRQPAALGECPYRGLSAFREQDAPFYFGRAADIDRLHQALEQQLLVAVLVGSSGCGKSSLINAGLMPRLKRRKDTLVVDFRPGKLPFHALAAALIPWLEPERSETERLVEIHRLAQALLQEQVSIQQVIQRILEKYPKIKRLLLFIDQFEELYTLCPDAETQHGYIDMLLQVIQADASQREMPVCILLALRADFMGQALSYRPFADALQESAYMLGPMSPVELHAVVEKPAEKLGVAFEDGLVHRILQDVGEHPGNLPLLEFALTLLWDQSVDGMLTHSAYGKIGYVEGALSRYAEQVFADLTPAEQGAARQIFTQLIQPGRGTEDTRRVASRREIEAENWPLVQHLANKRLVVTGLEASGAETVEIVHEALIQHWERLKSWMDADRDFRNWQEMLRLSIRQWEEAGRDESGLLRGVMLAQAENWLTERQAGLSRLEVQFIQESTALHVRQEQDRQEQARQELEKARALAATERRARRTLGALAGVLALAVVLAAGLTAFANQQRRQALNAYSLSLAANAQKALAERDSATALVLALAANAIAHPPLETQRILLNAAYAPGARSRQPISTLFSGEIGPATCLDYSPDGSQIILGLAGGHLVFWDASGGGYQVLSGHTGKVNAVRIAPDGLTAVSVAADNQVIVWDLRTGRQLRQLGTRGKGHTGTVRTVDISSDGRWAVTGGLAGVSIFNPGELILWDLQCGQELRRFSGHLTGVVSARFTPDGRHILSSSGDWELLLEEQEAPTEGGETKDLLLWDTGSGEISTRYSDLEYDVYTLEISPDGRRALLGSYYDNVVSVLDLASGKATRVLSGHQNAVRDVAFLPGGQSALSAGDDNRLILWNLATGEPEAIFKAGESNPLALAIHPDGHSALSATRNGNLFRWDLQDTALLRRFGAQGDAIFDVDFTAAGQQVLSCSGSPAPDIPARDTSVRLWDLQSGRLLQTMPLLPLPVIYQCAASPDGRWAISVGPDALVRVWDLHSGQELQQLTGHTDWVYSLAITQDGKRALTGSKDGSLIYWDTEQWQIIHKLAGVPSYNWSLAISPDGSKALADAGPQGAVYWDLVTGTAIRQLVRDDLPEGTGASGIAFLPDGRTAVTGENDGYLIQWDLETGRELRRFGRHEDLRARVEISQDGKTMLTSGMNGVLRLWDLQGGELLREFGYTGPALIFDIHISPDGATAISGSIDQVITQWSLHIPDPEELLAWIQANRYLRELSCAERASYQIKPLCEAK